MNIFISSVFQDVSYQVEIIKALRKIDGVNAYTVDLLGTLGPKGVFDSDRLYEKLDYPDLALPLLSNHYFYDPWFYHELPALFAIESRLNIDIILPVLIDDLDEKHIPEYLLKKGPVDFRGKELSEALPQLIERVQGAHKRELAKVFIVHGRDDLTKEAVARFIERLGLEVIILHEQANKGMAIIEKLEKHMDVGFAIVLLTPDDVGALHENANNLQPRARQNVIFELGLFIGQLGRRRVCTLYKGPIELPSDYQGMVFIPMDDGGGWRPNVAKELKEAGFAVDIKKAL